MGDYYFAYLDNSSDIWNVDNWSCSDRIAKMD